MHVGAKRTAIRQALSLKSQAGAIIVVSELGFKEAKTSEAVKLLAAVKATRNILVVVDKKTPEISRVFANIPNTQVVNAAYLNVYAIMNADTVVFTNKALNVVHDWLKTAKVATKEAAK